MIIMNGTKLGSPVRNLAASINEERSQSLAKSLIKRLKTDRMKMFWEKPLIECTPKRKSRSLLEFLWSFACQFDIDVSCGDFEEIRKHLKKIILKRFRCKTTIYRTYKGKSCGTFLQNAAKKIAKPTKQLYFARIQTITTGYCILEEFSTGDLTHKMKRMKIYQE